MRVLITGITGFVGSHFAEYLLGRNGVEVWGSIRWRSRTDNIDHLRERVNLFECDLRDATSARNLLEKSRPDYIFHLAAQSFVPTSWHAPSETLSTNVIGTLNILEAVRSLAIRPRIQIAGSSEEYGKVYGHEIPIVEENALRPLSPYAVSKAAADLLGYQYYESYQMHIVRTRAFNHTGPRRGEVFVTSNFAKQVASIEAGHKEPVIRVGNLDAIRDFTDVRDVVQAYWLALEVGKPGDVYNICSGRGIRIGDMLQMLIQLSGANIRVAQDESRLRPSDVPILVGSAAKFKAVTGWERSIPFEDTLASLLEYWRARMPRAASAVVGANVAGDPQTGAAVAVPGG